ncbi:hypothetical protein I7I53_00931 [Histoplasma capsulatum var. duboisii H88]|uniref:Uncharacterized protein n=1 Tax=Ajellomyces capsulatus (strain H88) TaxID=544711 RepID=A0A8A1LNP5_AJEC8|nr:hypothetical protein I7I53_00931 [Histoplasma capsulatum var. duboisii H88]
MLHLMYIGFSFLSLLVSLLCNITPKLLITQKGSEELGKDIKVAQHIYPKMDRRVGGKKKERKKERTSPKK